MMWLDDEVQIELHVSTSGDFVSLGTRTDYPFTPGGSGWPQGWTRDIQGGLSTDVTMTTQDGRYSVSNASSTDAHNGKFYGIYRDFPTVDGHRYIIHVQARTMEGKSSPFRSVFWRAQGAGQQYGNNVIASPDWEQTVTMYEPAAGAGYTFVRVYLYANPYWVNPADFKFDWGVQFQNVAIIDAPMTLPPPTWHQVTCDTKSVRTAHGRSRMASRYEVATAEIQVRNDDGEFAYQLNHPWGFRPGRFLKVTAKTPDAPTVEKPQFYGVIDTVTDAYSLDGHAVVNLSCIDVSSLLSTTNVPTITTVEGPSGIRFQMVLMSTAWNDSMYEYDYGQFIQQGILASGRTIREELGIIADSEGGYFYADRSGKLIYHDRNAPTWVTPWNTVQAELLAECPPWVYPVKMVLPGVAGNYLSVPHEAAFNVSTAFQITLLLKFDDINGGAQTLMDKSAGWWFRKQAGNRRLEASIGGTTTQVSTAELPQSSGETFWVRLARASDNTVAFGSAPYTGTDTVPAAGAFTRLGAILTVDGPMPTNTQPIKIGARGAGDIDLLKGTIYRATLFASNSSSATKLLDVQADELAGNVGATSFRVSTGQVMTAHQTEPNVIMQIDPAVPPTALIPADSIPTVVSPPMVMLRTLETDWSRDRVINTLELANAGGNAVQFVDADSQKRYGPRTYQRLDLVNSNAHPEYLTQRAADLMDGFTEAVLRVNGIGFRPSRDTYKWAATAFLNDLVRVRYTHPTGGWGFSVVSHIQGMEHTITPTDWSVQIRLDEPEAFNRWVLSGSGWDIGLWDQMLWDEE